MKQQDQSIAADIGKTTAIAISRRRALRSSGAAALALLSGSALGQTEVKKPQTKAPAPKPPREIEERMEQSREFAERLRNAATMEERRQIMNEQMAWQRQRAVEDLKDQLGLSNQEWSAVKPRLLAVYDLVHPRAQMGRSEPPKTELDQRIAGLRELLRDEKAKLSQIKAKLTALRAAKERTVQELVRARQNLRQVMTLRQEALLVLNGLLD